MTHACRRGALVFLLFLLLHGCSGESSPQRADPREAPDFVLTTLEGDQVTLSAYRGNVVLLDFWATWCPPCRTSIAHNVELQEKYGPRGFTVLGLSLDKNPEDVEQFLRRQDVNFPMMFLDEPTRQAYGGVPTIPYSVLIDRTGRIRQKKLGFTREVAESVERTIERLLTEGTPLPYGS
ncbi:MAG: TlpA disulfide reductase family protein [Deferrisomatales bacterium]|nr:TlpA disulfide reductase family protein [Deferrisomatales bacterium]